MTSGRRLFCLLLSIVVASMKKFTLQSLKVADGKLSERSCWLVKAQLEEPEEQGLVDVYFFSPKIPSYYGSFLCTEIPNIMGLFYVHQIPNIMGLFYVH